MLSNLATLAVFTVFRLVFPSHAPDPYVLITTGWGYVKPRPGYILAWGVGLLAVSCGFAFVLAQLARTRLNIGWLTPDIVQTSAWNLLFGDRDVVPDGCIPWVGIELQDGKYITGYVDWFSTELDEVADRDLVLASPIWVYTDADSAKITFSKFIVSARDIRHMYVDYFPYHVDGPSALPTTGGSPD